VLWLLGSVFLVAPLAVAVGTLTVKYPSAGGLYIWTRNDFGPWHGFLCFWCYWIQMALWFPSAAMFYMSAAAYTFGPKYAHLADSRIYVVAASLAAIWVALGTNIAGVNIGKWTENVGGAASWVLAVVLITVAAIVWNRQGSATPLHFAPEWNWGTVNLWGVIAFAMSGLELIGLMGGEMRNPRRDVPRAGWIASAFTVVFYSTTTLALLVLLRPEKISELNGLAEGAGVAGNVLSAPWITWHWSFRLAHAVRGGRGPSASARVRKAAPAMGDALRFDPGPGRGVFRVIGCAAVRRHDARGLPIAGVVDGDLRISSVPLCFWKRVESRKAAQRNFGLDGHGAGHSLLRSSDG
jgi:amino acid transporter